MGAAGAVQELSNLLWAFVKFRHSPRRLLTALEARVGDPEVVARMQSSNWAVLVWAAATMGMELQASTYAALPVGDALGAFSAAEQCNVLWCGCASKFAVLCADRSLCCRVRAKW